MQPNRQRHPKHHSEYFEPTRVAEFSIETNVENDNFLLWAAGKVNERLVIDNGISYSLLSDEDKLIHSAQTFSGMSGGAVLVCENKRFRLAGMITGYAVDKDTRQRIQNVSFSVNVKKIKELIMSIRPSGEN